MLNLNHKGWIFRHMCLLALKGEGSDAVGVCIVIGFKGREGKRTNGEVLC
jgi:hypothetical protein